MTKKLAIITLTYIVFLSCIVVYKIAKKDNAYYNYKKVVAKSAENIKASSKDIKETSSIVNKANDTNNNGNTGGTASAGTENNNTTGTSTSVANTGATANGNNTVETYSKIKFTRHLASGAVGDDVKKLQYILKEKGFYKGEITGSFDKDTSKALVEYQKSKNIKPADGILGPGTWGSFQ